ncbi:hypothetical protein Hanom_Chr15g01366901 [Helianthus anomalus]
MSISHISLCSFSFRCLLDCHTPIFPRITGGPGGEYRDVVDIVIVKQHNLMHNKSRR